MLQPTRVIAEIVKVANFQFPLAERTCCNRIKRARRGTRDHLSVSSSGTNVLQLLARYRIQAVIKEFFQFPLAERTCCNRDRRRAAL